MKPLLISNLLFLIFFSVASGSNDVPVIEKTQNIQIISDQGWILSFHSSGSARLIYGSHLPDGAFAPPGTFLFSDIYNSLIHHFKTSQEKGDLGVGLSQKGVVMSTVRYINPSIGLPLFLAAKKHVKPFDPPRFNELLEKYPFVMPSS